MMITCSLAVSEFYFVFLTNLILTELNDKPFQFITSTIIFFYKIHFKYFRSINILKNT